MALINKSSNDKFLSILSDGTIRLSVPEGTEGAQKREYETSDGKTGVKYELVYTELSGMITGIKFWEGDFGKSIQLTITDGDEDPVVLSVSTASSFGEDLMKKLPAIETSKPIVLSPYSFEDDRGKKRKGITIRQGENKIENYYYDKDTKKNIHGYPETDFGKKKPSKDDWKMYFMKARLFLIDQIVERFGIDDIETEDDKANKKFDKMGTEKTDEEIMI
jgi:hypothetical protein